MSNFKVGDMVVAVSDCMNGGFVAGDLGVVTDIRGVGVAEVKFDDYYLSAAAWFHELWLADKKPSKPAKKYTEADRRKAAKDVRVAFDKLDIMIHKAKDAGIELEFVQTEKDSVDIWMTYQPETPKKRVY